MSAIGWYRSSACSFKQQLDRPSGPGALCLFRCDKFPLTRSGETSRNTHNGSNRASLISLAISFQAGTSSQSPGRSGRSMSSHYDSLRH